MSSGAKYQDFLARIDKNSNSFSKNEAKLAQIFRQKREVLLELSIATIAEQAEVSNATVSRFIRKLGYDDFNEFRYMLQSTQKRMQGESAIAQETNFVDLLRTDYNTLLDRATSLVSKNDLTYFVQKLTSAKNIYASGLGYSGLSAKEMDNKFINIGILVKSLDDTSFILAHANTMGANDLFIVFSMRGESEQLLAAMRIAKANGTTIILISNFSCSPMSVYADKVLLTAQKSDLSNNLTITPQFAQIFLIDLLFNAVLMSNFSHYSAVMKRLNGHQWQYMSGPHQSQTESKK